MAFGGRKGTALTGNAASIGTSLAATGSQAVAVGDLVFVALFEQTTSTMSACGDNLHGAGSYTLLAATDAGTTTVRCAYIRVTVAGTLTTVTAVTNGGSNNGVIDAVVYEGPFVVSPADVHPTDISNDINTPYLGPASGALAYAPELVVTWAGSTGSATWSVAAPYSLDSQHATASVGSIRIASQKVDTKASVAAASWTGTAPTDDVLGVASFKGAPLPNTTWPENNFTTPNAKMAIAAVVASGCIFNPSAPLPPPGPAIFTGAPISSVAISEISISGSEPVTPQAPPNTVTIDKWLRPLSRAVPHGWPAKPFQPFVPVAATSDNTVTPDKWLVSWQGPPRYLQGLPGGQPFVPKEATRENTVTPNYWMVRWKDPPRYLQNLPGGQPFVAAQAVVDNTVTPDKWMRPLAAPPRYLQGLPGGQPFIPEAAVVENTVTPDNWMRPLATPPRYLQPLPGGQPFVPKEAVLDNTVTPDAWMGAFQKAVPIPNPAQSNVTYAWTPILAPVVAFPEGWQVSWQGPPRYLQTLQPGSPFIPKAATVDNTVTPDNWLLQWPGPPRYTPPFGDRQYEPFLPEEAVLENTVTPDKWLQAWRGPPRYQAPLGGQPFVPRAAVLDNTVTPDTWMVRWPDPPKVFQPSGDKLYEPFWPEAAVIENTVTPDKWLNPFFGPPRYLQNLPGGQPFIPKEATVENTVTPDKWVQGLSIAVPHSWPNWQAQPYFLPLLSANPTPANLEWLRPFDRPANLWQRLQPGQPFVPKEATVENNVNFATWWRPLNSVLQKYSPAKSRYEPFVPKEATVDNTVTPDKWVQRLSTAVPHAWPNWQAIPYCQPVPSISATPTALGWLRPFDRPANLFLRLPGGSPFIPEAATIENTVTIDKWQQGFTAAVAHPWPVPRERPYYFTVPIPTATPAELGWFVQLSKAADTPKPRPRAKIFYSPLPTPPPFVPNTVTIDKWQQPFYIAVSHGWGKYDVPGFAFPVFPPPTPPGPPPKEWHPDAPAVDTWTQDPSSTAYDAFQCDAFQNDAFQTGSCGGQWSQDDEVAGGWTQEDPDP